MGSIRTALVIDTDPAFRQFVALRLEILGFRVREAENQAQVRSAVMDGDADLVISECAVPALEGNALLGVLEPHKRPVFLLTEWTPSDMEGFLKETRVRAVIPKKKKTDLFRQLDSLESIPKAEPAEGKGPEKQVLLIEDSPTIRHFVRRTLEKGLPGCVIREAEDGRDAISEMAQRKVDLIVTDLQMPGMDGPTFLRMIRRNNLLKQKPVLVFSSSVTAELRAEFGGDSCMEFLLKPANPEQILEAIGRLWVCQEAVTRNLKR